MSLPAIEVTGLAKRYVIEHESRHDSLRDTLHHAARKIWRRARWGTGFEKEEFWALRDVNFQVQPGEVVGVIGRNGAGKSTLLKILSRITEPTRGRVTLRGRVASLLEVGTGFHPDLSGRENIFLNGAILGMSRQEICAKFDEIVAFAEIEKFIDTPVKRYSSGMYVRLAFSVAAHLEPEILIVDEVLAVGDAAFQNKCLRRMEDVATQGRTVLFVSHDMGNITKLCHQGLLLDHGVVEFKGEMNAAVGRYLSGNVTKNGIADLRQHSTRTGDGTAKFESIELLGDGARTSTIAFGGAVQFRVALFVRRAISKAVVAVIVSTSEGIPVHCFDNTNANLHWNAVTGRHHFDITLERLLLYPGSYSISLWIGESLGGRADYVRDVVTFHVVQTPASGLDRPLLRSNGLVFAPSRWEHSHLD